MFQRFIERDRVRYETGCEKIGEKWAKRSRNPCIPAQRRGPWTPARIAIVLIPHSFLVMARRDGTKGQQTGQPRPFRCPSTMTCALHHHSSFTHASNIPPFLLRHARYRSNWWTSCYYARWIEISPFVTNLVLFTRFCDLEIMNICFFFFFKEVFIFIVFRRINWNTFRFIRSRRGFFSLSIDNRNIFQGERRGGGENLLGWRIVLFFFFFFDTSWMKRRSSDRSRKVRHSSARRSKTCPPRGN